MTRYFNQLILLTVLSVCSYSTYADTDDNEGIDVVGNGSVIAIPDQFSLSLTITERGRIPSKLHPLVDNKTNLVIDAAKQLGITTKDIKSAQVNLRLIKEKPSITVQGLELQQGKQGSVFVDGKNVNNTQTPIQLFELSRYITVNFANINDYDQFLAKIVKLNVSHISALSMTVKQRDDYYQQALMKAIDHAKQKATKMIAQTGGTLGKLVYLKEVSSGHYQPRYAQAMMSESMSVNYSSLVGSQEISASVLVKFAIKP
ncbi:SIMPL domain-containing protein [Colwellia sp. D2M02]|uniref:SIMPL domain-containing protein n=1 Tax=Colwellia sp. D2M02 TaxID=2841562 RepID=UPI001C098D7D|nr:SIMPL domain-containing protein [Colwellia sp. D2M02]MBU2894113.1 SIMPL domain-containing protein [Colwellia sp. D2M02]